MTMTEQVIKSFRPTQDFNDYKEIVNNLSFSTDGKLLITSSDDDQLIIYDCVAGGPSRTIYSKKYGVTLAQFTRSVANAIHGSNKVDDGIRYLSLNDNKFIRYFMGHSKKVVCLNQSPMNETFISGSLDQTIRLWDLRQPSCQGVMHVQGRPVCNFDPEGLVFVAGMNAESVKLYDQRNLEKGPFVSFKIQTSPGGLNGDNDGLAITEKVDWTDLKFSPDGTSILVSTNGPNLFLLDAFNGELIHKFHVVSNAKQRLPLVGQFTPDSKYVLCGSPLGRIYVWRRDNGQKVCVLSALESNSPATPLTAVAFNPKYAMMASAAVNLTFWLPTAGLS